MAQQPPANANTHGQQQGQPPAYDVSNGGHYGASQALSSQGYAPVAEFYTGSWANVLQLIVSKEDH